MQLRLGTRASALATWQATWVAERLREQGIGIELVPITTAGDREPDGPVERIGAQGVFTKEIQRALLDGRIDVAVHSLKDLSTAPVDGLVLAAVPARGPIADAVVFHEARRRSLKDLAPDAVVGTGSLRRQTQLLRVRADLKVVGIRGNVETRLAKLDAGKYDAVVLAEAGLQRLGLEGRIGAVLPLSVMLPAVGQGALGIETRENDRRARDVVACIDHAATRASVLAERAMLAAMRGGCRAPIGAWGRVEGGVLRLTGRVVRIDGSRQADATADGQAHQPEALGHEVAERLLLEGAGEWIAEARQSP